MASTDVLVKRGALTETKLAPSAPLDLADGDVLMRVDLFSITANNVTYGAFGEFMKYWDFYPAPEGWGRVPVWGFATVMESRSPDVKPGQRVYGYLPMSNLFRLRPGKPANGAMVEQSPHRSHLAPPYNRYLFTAEDPLYSADTEPLQAVFRPLFGTSFLIDDFLADNGFFGAKQVVFSSASARTSWGTAQLLKARGKVKVIGLTSPANIAFTQGLGFYDQVIAYDALGSLDASAPTVFVDIAGDSRVRAAVHEHWADNLKYSCAVGATHWDVERSSAPLPGPKPQMFFAPGVMQKRMADWGPVVLMQKFAEGWRAFLPTAARTTRIVESKGLAEAARVFADHAAGRVKPGDGTVIRL
jgi:hypothetical protein